MRASPDRRLKTREMLIDYWPDFRKERPTRNSSYGNSSERGFWVEAASRLLCISIQTLELHTWVTFHVTYFCITPKSLYIKEIDL